MQINDLQRNTRRQTKKRVGRGGVRGKTSGRGHKGQGQHASHGPRPMVRDIIKKLPKLRGYRFNSRFDDPIVVNVSQLDDVCNDGDTVNPQFLFDNGLIHAKKDIKRGVKILGNGDIETKITVEKCALSQSASDKITKAGGSVATS